MSPTLAYCAAFFLTLAVGFLALAGWMSRKRLPDPMGGVSKYGALDKSRIATVERQDALRRMT